MNKRKTNLVTAILALCVAILALLAVFNDYGGVSTARGSQSEESPVITWEVGPLPDTAPPVIAVETTPMPVPRYAVVYISEDERQEMAGIIFLEAGNQCAEEIGRAHV